MVADVILTCSIVIIAFLLGISIFCIRPDSLFVPYETILQPACEEELTALEELACEEELITLEELASEDESFVLSSPPQEYRKNNIPINNATLISGELNFILNPLLFTEALTDPRVGE